MWCFLVLLLWNDTRVESGTQSVGGTHRPIYSQPVSKLQCLFLDRTCSDDQKQTFARTVGLHRSCGADHTVVCECWGQVVTIFLPALVSDFLKSHNVQRYWPTHTCFVRLPEFSLLTQIQLCAFAHKHSRAQTHIRKRTHATPLHTHTMCTNLLSTNASSSLPAQLSRPPALTPVFSKTDVQAPVNYGVCEVLITRRPLHAGYLCIHSLIMHHFGHRSAVFIAEHEQVRDQHATTRFCSLFVYLFIFDWAKARWCGLSVQTWAVSNATPSKTKHTHTYRLFP